MQRGWVGGFQPIYNSGTRHPPTPSTFYYHEFGWNLCSLCPILVELIEKAPTTHVNGKHIRKRYRPQTQFIDALLFPTVPWLVVNICNYVQINNKAFNRCAIRLFSVRSGEGRGRRPALFMQRGWVGGCQHMYSSGKRRPPTPSTFYYYEFD